MGEACEGAAARQVARRMRLAQSTVRAIDLRYLERWEARRRLPPLRHMGVDEIYKGKREKFLTVVCNLETGEPLWFGRERRDARRILPLPLTQPATETHRGGSRGYVGALPAEH